MSVHSPRVEGLISWSPSQLYSSNLEDIDRRALRIPHWDAAPGKRCCALQQQHWIQGMETTDHAISSRLFTDALPKINYRQNDQNGDENCPQAHA